MPKWYKKPIFVKVNSFIVDKKVFIKPTCEGTIAGSTLR
jgi:hypothetical protein